MSATPAVRSLVLWAALGWAVFPAPAAPAQTTPVRGLTASAQLARVYDAIFDARFDALPELLDRTCGPVPPEVCQVLDAVAAWWEIQLDPQNTLRDREFLAKADAAVAAVEAWTQREPLRAEAWFYLGGAYGARVQWRVLRNDRLAAARDGKRIKEALERALELDPEMHDAHFGIGLYRYYADVAPTAAKVLRWLLFLPGGDRVKGLREMVQARDRGALLRSEADYQLHIIYLWYERNAPRALDLLEALGSRHAFNPHFLQLTAEVQDTYLHDATASLRTWRRLLEAARQRRVAFPAMADARARLGLALQLDRLYETDRAVEHLQAVIAAAPAAPFGAVARAHLQLGQALDRIGRREAAIASYRAAIAASGERDALDIAERARDGLRRGPDPKAAEAYRLSLEGWRAIERGALADAGRALDASLAIRPADPVTRFRQARLLQARKEEQAALAIFDSLARVRGTTPPTFYATACVEAARMHEARGDRGRATELYGIATGVFGADQRTKDAAQRALTRLKNAAATGARR